MSGPDPQQLAHVEADPRPAANRGGAAPAPGHMLDRAAASLGPAALARKLAQRRQRRGPRSEAAPAATQVTVAQAQADLRQMIAGIEARVLEAIGRYLLVDQAIQAEGIEAREVDVSGAGTHLDAGRSGLGQAGAHLAASLGVHEAVKYGDMGAGAIGLAGHLGVMVKLLLGAAEIFDDGVEAKHSLAHRRACRRVVAAARHDLHRWCERQRQAVAAARSLDELRDVGDGIVAMLGPASHQVAVVQQLQAWVIKLETQDASYTTTEAIAHTQRDRERLGRALTEAD